MSVGAWTLVCPVGRIVPDTGVAALVDGVQVAVFRLGDGRLYAIGNHDPCSGADVLSRGIVGHVDARAGFEPSRPGPSARRGPRPSVRRVS